MPNVIKFQRRKFPSDAAPCLDKLASHARAGTIAGVAFICLLHDDGFIADTCGTARDRPDQIRELLKALDAKIAKRQLRERE